MIMSVSVVVLDVDFNQLEEYAKNSPVPFSGTVYCFNAVGEKVFGKPYKNYDYFDVTEEDREKIRTYWEGSEYEVVFDVWDDADEWLVGDSND